MSKVVGGSCVCGAVGFEMSGDQQQRLGVRNSWDLVAYIRSLRQDDTTAAAVLGTPAEGATP